jgi:hypothetical protein
MVKRPLGLWSIVASLAGAASAIHIVGCGGSSATSVGAADGSADGANVSTNDANVASDDGSAGQTDANGSGPMSDATTADASPADAGSNDASSNDAASSDASACPSATACSNGGADGICASDACGPCDDGSTSAGPDTGCTAAYGGGSTSYVCSAGACIPGNCNSNTDCSAPTPTCGFSTPNVCGGCTSDSQCSNGNICDTKAGDAGLGTCVAATTGCTAGLTDGACSLNASDECCAGSCVPGDCCLPTANTTSFCGSSATCKSETSAATGGGICTTCAVVTGTSPTYFVDPVNGSDTTGTGNRSASNACAFQTITRALQIIGASPPSGTSISIVNAAGTGTVTVSGVASGTPGTGLERFPIVLPANVTLTTAGGAVTIEVPAAAARATTTGIILAGNPSAISGGANASLIVDGQSKTATYGVEVASPAAALSALTIRNFGTDGIAINDSKAGASALAIGAGLQSNGNGADGLSVAGTSTVTIAGSAAAPTQFNGNGAHGIYVRGASAITVNGSVGASPPSTSTVVTSANGAAGIWIQQTAGTASKNTLTGVVCTTSVMGNGLRIVPGSNVTVRSGWFLGNTGSGIDIENIAGGTATGIGNIDLGTAASPGANVVQAPPGGSVNGNAGICLQIAAGADVQLAARGNVFGGDGTTAVDCASGAGVLRTASAASLKCENHADVGGNVIAFPGAGAGNTIDVTQCSY